MRSMTGFGRGDYKDDSLEINIEIKTINHRYKDFFIRMPRHITFAEDNLRKEISDRISRGRIEVNVKTNTYSGQNKSIKLNLELAREYVECLKELKTNVPEITGEYSLSLISRFPDVISSEENEVDAVEMWEKIKTALNAALDNIVQSRENEGEILKKDFIKRLLLIEDFLKEIIGKVPEIADEYRNKLIERIKEFTNNIEIDENRLLTEVAYYSDKINITEEITRLKSHIQRFRKIIDENDSVGRKLDFLIQEMHREINTIGSKANHITISNYVVDVKSEIEKMREQIQNIE
ncbi:MAG: YicC family protein [Eubacteriaceae bacterium]|nr:YicC family protein [Eubacteriaceae bacterium]